jgi:hypothetical protein
MQRIKKSRNQKIKKLKPIVFLIFCFIVFLISYPRCALADYYFNPHFILTDEEMTDYQSMSLAGIELFLEDKGSYLANRYFPDYNEINKTAAEIIWQAARESEISPKVLLVTLQKEQSLIEDSAPTQRQIDRAMGYRCPDDGVCNPSTLHFGKQVDGAAWQFQQYFDNPLDWTYQKGETYEIDGFLITPVNQATANLYTYTPHYSGNKRFWQIWQDYWGRNYPDGSLLKAYDNPGVWLVQYGMRRLITSWGILLSRFDPNKIITVSRTDLEKYEIGPSIKFYNYSLLETPDGRIYLLVDDKLRYITSPEVFRIIGFHPEEVIEVAPADLAGYSYGPDITVESVYPTGALIQNNETGGVYYVENGIKQPIYSREIMDANFKSRILTAVSPEELEQYPTGSPVKFKDGELIKGENDSKVYVISDGYRRWVKSEEAFANFAYKWDNIIVTNQQAINIHPLGEDIE